ncbi:hypothetical protein [Hymenobacter psychrophilus]|uniref:Uncharacterized protein n=1 Tax=Hymenobacter psychrophilus TaxID=651662 RepID=A0A1H3LRW2_9BACT|nr:hypothetical protein [Hymenobacter psychrophilus]SDY67287.1 hypothetical protein SAMN04488069_111112 [Hymenobacter psychrophilus]
MANSLQPGQLTQEDEDTQGQVNTEALELLFGSMMYTHACLTPARCFLVRWAA